MINVEGKSTYDWCLSWITVAICYHCLLEHDRQGRELVLVQPVCRTKGKVFRYPSLEKCLAGHGGLSQRLVPTL